MGALDIIKDVIEITQKAGSIDVTRQLIDVQREVMDLQMENFELKKKNAELEDTLNMSKRIVYGKYRSAVYEVLENGLKAGPYCTHCWEVDRKTVTLLKESASRYKCPHCKLETKNIVDENRSESSETEDEMISN